MIKIGAIWGKTADKTNKRYLSFALDPAVLELYPQLKGCSIVAFYIGQNDRKNENSPDYELFLDVKGKKKQDGNQDGNIVEFVNDEEIPF